MPTEDEPNPYERWGIDPRSGPSAITERMREAMEDASDDATRSAIRDAWEELTFHPARRLRAALGAHPDSHGPRGAPPPAPFGPSRAPSAPCLLELLPRPSVLDALGLEADAPLPDVPFDRDPILND